ncbi:MAG: nuclear transport factor 2 family protein [Actinomycetota bacterium]|nr:nuclear transport factor 2 family protein [Actinomycetota bacterium]
MTHPNEEILRMQDKALMAGDVAGFFDGFTDDVVAHIGGKNPLAGTYKGKEQLQEAFGKWMEMSGNLQQNTHDILANDTHGVVIGDYSVEKNGKTAQSRAVQILHFKGGKVSEAWIFDEDPYTTDAFYNS